MRVFNVENFIKNNYSPKFLNTLILPTISICGIINFSLFYVYLNKDSFLFIISFVLLSTIVMSYLIISIYNSHQDEKRRKNTKIFFEELKKHTIKTKDYKCINFLILDRSFYLLSEDFKQAFQNTNINFEKLAYKGRVLFT